MGLSSLGWLVFVVGVACENVVWEQYLTYSSPGCDVRRLIAQKAFPVASQVCFPKVCHNLNGTSFWRSVSLLEEQAKAAIFSFERDWSNSFVIVRQRSFHMLRGSDQSREQRSWPLFAITPFWGAKGVSNQRMPVPERLEWWKYF